LPKSKPKPDGSLIVRRVPLDSLHEDPANVRLHDEKNRASIRESLFAFGQVEPLVVQRGTGRVIGGNARLGEMRAIGLDECDIVEVDLDDVRATALGVALNRTASLATWDEEALAATLESLRSEPGFDLATVGYDEDELQAMLDRLGTSAIGESGNVILPPGADGREYDESVADEVKYLECPSCGHRFPK
jgi:ParB-like chromosome segregation protein Spo0J